MKIEEVGDLMDGDEQLTLLGYVGVDSGRLTIIDPCYDYDTAIASKLAVTFSDFGGDGYFPVYAVKVDGSICRVIIDLLNTEDLVREEDDE
jgi:hypothetical protein